MLSEMSKKTESLLQLNRANNLPISDSNLSPARQALRQRAHRARKNRRRTLAEYRQAIRNQANPIAPTTRPPSITMLQLTRQRIEQYQHAVILAQLAHKLSIVYGIKNDLLVRHIMQVFDSHNWTCPVSGVKHTADTPLTFDFTFKPHLGGKLSVANMKPRYVPNLLAGEWYIERPQLRTLPRYEYQYLPVGA